MTRTERALFVLLFASYAYFYQAGGWNQNSRFNLVRAITNEHSLRVDPFQASTGDKAFFDGHYYSDKAPGLSFAAVPPVFVARPIMRAFGGDPESYGGIAFLSYLSTVLTSGLFTALAAVVLFRLCLELGASRAGALAASLTYGLGSPMWPLATLFIGHALSAACLVMAFSLAVAGFSRPMDARLKVDTTYLLIGVLAGWATVTEYPAAVPAALIALLAAANALRLGRTRALRLVLALTAGALACAAALMLYQYACFGSPFHIAYTSEAAGFEGMQQGLFGINTPKLVRLQRILFGDYRGLLPLAPALAVAPFGLIALFVGERTRRAALVSTAIALYYVLLNASYTYWEGGWSYGPRHLSPAIPFLCLGLAVVWTRVPRLLQLVLALACAAGIAVTLVAVSTMAQPPAQIRRPVAGFLLPAFRDGDLALNTQRFTDGSADPAAMRAHVDPKAAWNLGMKMGLEGRASLAPLALVWIACAAWLTSASRAPSRAD